MHGRGAGLVGGDSCGSESGSAGDTGLHWVTSEGERRDLPFIETSAGVNSPLTEGEEAALESRFGPPVERVVRFPTRGTAIVLLWWLPGLVVSTLAAAVVFGVTLRRRLTLAEPAAHR